MRRSRILRRWGTPAALALALTITIAPAAAHDDDDPADGKSKSAIMGADLATLDRPASAPIGPTECVDGRAGIFPCDNVDLASFVPLEQLGGGTGNDIWGWTDPQTGSEYAIMGTANGTAFVDVTEPTEPVVTAIMPTQSALLLPLWRDIKVHDNHAFVVSEHDNHGMQVFDLTRLRDVVVPQTLVLPDTVYSEISNTHNIAVNTDTGYAYAVGTNTCDGGLHMIDINRPKQPTFAGCFSDDGYTHDVECVIYRGQDGRYRGKEICFASNEDTLTIVDVTDKTDPTMISRTGYDTAAYTHQGSLTPDHRWFLFGDELDESGGNVDGTTTYITEVRKLDRPGTPQPFVQDNTAIDHNLYIRGDRVTESNYTAGVRFFTYDRSMLREGRLEEVGYFDVVPESDVTEFAGTWSNYTFDSGTVVASTLESGLFVLQPRF
jgi:choice-of-anchor B domain-containing protein